MGRFDSSKTRVQPVFRALHRLDPSGERWLRSLLQIAGRGSEPKPPSIPFDIGTLKQGIGKGTDPNRGVCFEFRVDPPRAFLKWLVEHPEKLRCPPDSEWQKWSDRTRNKRRALLNGDRPVQAEALTEIGRTPLRSRGWWRLEGRTSVDCALFTETAVIFIEGKRTERGPSKNIVWYAEERDQVLRNLDCAAEYAREHKIPYFFALMVIEKVVHDEEALNRTITDPISTRKSLPHLDEYSRRDLLSHYLGTTTWQGIVETFSLPRHVLRGIV